MLHSLLDLQFLDLQPPSAALNLHDNLYGKVIFKMIYSYFKILFLYMQRNCAFEIKNHSTTILTSIHFGHAHKSIWRLIF